MQAAQTAAAKELAAQQLLLDEANTSFEAVQARATTYKREKVELTRRLSKYKKEVDRLTRQVAATNEDNVLLGKQVRSCSQADGACARLAAWWAWYACTALCASRGVATRLAYAWGRGACNAFAALPHSAVYKRLFCLLPSTP